MENPIKKFVHRNIIVPIIAILNGISENLTKHRVESGQDSINMLKDNQQQAAYLSDRITNKHGQTYFILPQKAHNVTAYRELKVNIGTDKLNSAGLHIAISIIGDKNIIHEAVLPFSECEKYTKKRGEKEDDDQYLNHAIDMFMERNNEFLRNAEYAFMNTLIRTFTLTNTLVPEQIHSVLWSVILDLTEAKLKKQAKEFAEQEALLAEAQKQKDEAVKEQTDENGVIIGKIEQIK